MAKKQKEIKSDIGSVAERSWKPSEWRRNRPIFDFRDCDDTYTPLDLFEPYKRPGDELRECILRNTSSGAPAAVTVADDDGSFEVSPLADIRLDKVEVYEAIGDKKIASTAAQSGVDPTQLDSSELDPFSTIDEDRPDTIASVAGTGGQVKEN